MQKLMKHYLGWGKDAVEVRACGGGKTPLLGLQGERRLEVVNSVGREGRGVVSEGVGGDHVRLHYHPVVGNLNIAVTENPEKSLKKPFFKKISRKFKVQTFICQ